MAAIMDSGTSEPILHPPFRRYGYSLWASSKADPIFSMIPKLPAQTNSYSFYVVLQFSLSICPSSFISDHVVLYSQPAMKEAGLPKSTFALFAVSCRYLNHIYLPTAIFSPPILSMLSLRFHGILLPPPKHQRSASSSMPQHLQIGLHRPSRMIISQPRDSTRCLHPSQLRSICLRNPYFLPLLCLMRRIRLWPLRAQRIPITVSLGWRCHLFFQVCEAGSHLDGSMLKS
jgi:hypothetical protein